MLKRDVTLKVQCTAEQAVAALEASSVGPSCPMVAILAGVPGFGDRRRVDRASRAVHAQTRETVNPP